jgi:hypothetical protein
MALFEKKKTKEKSLEKLKMQREKLIEEQKIVDKKIEEIEQSATKEQDAEPMPESEPQEEQAEKTSQEEIRLREELDKKEIEIKTCREEIANLQARLEELNAKRMPEDCPTPDTSNDDIRQTLKSLQEGINQLSAQLNAENGRLIQENEALQDLVDKKQERLEQISQNCQEDRYRKDKSRLIDRYIYLMDIIRQTLYDYDYNRERILPAGADAEAFLKQQLEAVIVAMNATLDSEKVIMLPSASEGTAVNPDLQEIIDVVSTDKPDMDGKVFRSVNPGYAWTLPYILRAKTTDTGQEIKNYRFLIRAEQVIVYKFNK